MQAYTLSTACYIFCVSLMTTTVSYKPVIIVHGLFDGSRALSNLSRFIHESHPGTDVTVIDLYDHIHSLAPLWKQVEGFKKIIYPIMERASNGVHLICFSQGGLICRGLLSVMPDHNVHTFVSLASPQAGQYGETVYFKHVFPKFVKSKFYIFCYSHAGQKFSICNYWKDPHHMDKYLSASDYLAVLNGERTTGSETDWKTNFLRIKKLVLIGGPDDGVITPWQSSHFGFYDENEAIVEMKEQEVFVKDTFGLKTLVSREDLAVCTFPGVHHTVWHSNESVYQDCIEQWIL
ncbi:lysosomal thioesterase PPT2-A-like [Paramormyrops kingsleyae]|uniref:lysosomal thioesterase PPT2-A-like n=1 Tax=Paramormyrops kingsleyae TaxID=1676925 RepID=UPI003B96DED5